MIRWSAGPLSIVLALSLLEAVFVSASAQGKQEILLNKGWKFTRENPPDAQKVDYKDSYWETISLPHTWNARDGQDGGNDYYRGTGWYRKTMLLEAGWRGKKLYLKCDAASLAAEVFINGISVGRHKGGFGAFCLDITPQVNPGTQATIALKVTNARDTAISPLRGDFTIYGGLYRGAHLLVTEELAISPLDDGSSGVYVRQANVTDNAADIEVTAKILNASDIHRSSKVRVTILDHMGKTAKQSETALDLGPNATVDAVLDISLQRPHLWNGRRDPYLYRVVTELLERGKVVDRVVESLGVRSFSIDADKGFFLNGKPYRLHGVNRHQDRENMGWAITEKEHIQDFRMIEEIGANAIRLAHYQQAKEFYDLCDRGGMVVWAELALVDEIHPSKEFAVVCQQQLRELIKQNFNHPSIFFWSLQNELIPDADPGMYTQLVKDLSSLAKDLDPTRLTAVASRSKYDGTDGINSATDVIGYNVYRGWYDGKPGDFGGYVDKLHENFPQHKIAISEYGAGASVRQHEDPPQKPLTRGPWHPEEWQSYLHEVTWKAMVERPYLWGTFIWNMFDFGSDGRSEGDRFGQNDKGLVSFDRTVRKDSFYWYKANWNPEPMVHITSRRFSPRPVGSIDLKVYSNCDSVELILNGSSLGVKSSVDKIFVWTACELKSGKNEIVAVGSKRVKDRILITGVAEEPPPGVGQ
ncbi:MAG TPA: beta-galactosidase [Bacteroidetes bacterium]|nr:beta-galactosidase [Bacteroidota bacterium]